MGQGVKADLVKTNKLKFSETINSVRNYSENLKVQQSFPRDFAKKTKQRDRMGSGIFE